jgi:polyribonucleotide nucleotidyltransferase
MDGRVQFFGEEEGRRKKKKQRTVVRVSTAGSISITGRQQENVKIQVDGMEDEAGLRRKNFPQVSVGKMQTWGVELKRKRGQDQGGKKKKLA